MENQGETKIVNPWVQWKTKHANDTPIDYMYRQWGKKPAFSLQTENGEIMDIHTCNQCVRFRGRIRGCKSYGGDIKATGNEWNKESQACNLFQAKPPKPGKAGKK